MQESRRRGRPLAQRSPRTRSVVVATSLLILATSPFAVAKTGDFLREGARNGTTSKETEIIASIATSSAAKGGFAMRMSNLSSTGGGFVNGCRASAAATSKPCYRASNLSDGRAFEFNSNNGLIVGAITAGAGGDTKKPFTTNATGVATGLNADRVDNLDAAAIIAAARTKTGLAAETADNAANAANAANADKLDGLDSADFAKVGERVLAYATIDDAGVVDPARSRGITQANIDPDTQVGIVCITGLSPRPKNVQVTAQGVFDGGQNDVIATTFVSVGTVSTGDCAGQLQVRTFDVSSAALADRPFLIWLAE